MDFERLCFYHRQKKFVDSAGKKVNTFANVMQIMFTASKLNQKSLHAT
jgi:hypothetical protein